VDEQLEGTCRILATVVAPCVADPFARTILDNLIANLRMVTGALPKVAAFVEYDNSATLDQLLVLREALLPELVARIDHAAAAAREPDADDNAVLHDRNTFLRGLLAEAVCAAHLTPDMRQSIETYMIDRASRVPMRYVPSVASGTPLPVPSTGRP
jgi:hypothetical protein